RDVHLIDFGIALFLWEEGISRPRMFVHPDADTSGLNGEIVRLLGSMLRKAVCPDVSVNAIISCDESSGGAAAAAALCRSKYFDWQIPVDLMDLIGCCLTMTSKRLTLDGIAIHPWLN